MKTYLRLVVCGWLIGTIGCKTTTPVPVADGPPVAVAPSQQMTLENVVEMSRNGTSANVIINQINNTGSVFQLTVEQIGYLKQQGVNDAVIEYMQTHHAGAVVGSAPPPPPAYVRPAAYAVYPYPAYAYPGPYVYPYGGCYVRGGYYCR